MCRLLPTPLKPAQVRDFFPTDPPLAEKVTKVSRVRHESQGQNFSGPACPGGVGAGVARVVAERWGEGPPRTGTCVPKGTMTFSCTVRATCTTWEAVAAFSWQG